MFQQSQINIDEIRGCSSVVRLGNQRNSRSAPLSTELLCGRVQGFWLRRSGHFFAIATFPSTNERIRDFWTLASLTCPVAIAGRHYAIGLYQVLAANALTYALVGLIVETLRHRLHHAN